MSKKDTARNLGHGGQPSRARLRIGDIISNHSNGFALGTVILTADGALPVEYLEAGDRVITRAGMRVLRGVDTPAPNRFSLTFDRAETVYADGVQVCSETGRALAA